MSIDLNIPYITMSNYVRNLYEPDIETLFRISDYLNVSIEELYGRQSKNTDSIKINEIRKIINQ